MFVKQKNKKLVNLILHFSLPVETMRMEFVENKFEETGI
jgi:hypothetical protein